MSISKIFSFFNWNFNENEKIENFRSQKFSFSCKFQWNFLKFLGSKIFDLKIFHFHTNPNANFRFFRKILISKNNNFWLSDVLTFFVFYKSYFSKNKTLFFSREGHTIFEPRSNPRCPYTFVTSRKTLRYLNSRSLYSFQQPAL